MENSNQRSTRHSRQAPRLWTSTTGPQVASHAPELILKDDTNSTIPSSIRGHVSTLGSNTTCPVAGCQAQGGVLIPFCSSPRQNSSCPEATSQQTQLLANRYGHLSSCQAFLKTKGQKMPLTQLGTQTGELHSVLFMILTWHQASRPRQQKGQGYLKYCSRIPWSEARGLYSQPVKGIQKVILLVRQDLASKLIVFVLNPILNFIS